MDNIDQVTIERSCKQVYNQLHDLYWEKSNYGYIETISKMFELVHGKVVSIPYDDYVQYDGHIITDSCVYHINGFIYDNNVKRNFFSLIDKLTIAYYVDCGGGNNKAAERFIKKIKEEL